MLTTKNALSAKLAKVDFVEFAKITTTGIWHGHYS